MQIWELDCSFLAQLCCLYYFCVKLAQSYSISNKTYFNVRDISMQGSYSSFFFLKVISNCFGKILVSVFLWNKNKYFDFYPRAHKVFSNFTNNINPFEHIHQKTNFRMISLFLYLKVWLQLQSNNDLLPNEVLMLLLITTAK